MASKRARARSQNELAAENASNQVSIQTVPGDGSLLPEDLNIYQTLPIQLSLPIVLNGVSSQRLFSVRDKDIPELERK